MPAQPELFPDDAAKRMTGALSKLRYSLLTAAICLLPMLSSPESQAQTSLPDLGDSSTTALSPAEEVKLGRRFMRQVRAQLPLIEDSDLTNYLNQLGERLAVAAQISPDRLEFFLIDDPSLNAFAAPGGYIGVHTGLFMAAHDESELAAVLAHELAHISQRHLARLIARSKELSLPAMAAVLAGVLIGGQAGLAALTATNAAVSSDSLSYSRNFEREADSIGIRTLNDAGFDPAGMTRFFSKMQRWARVQEIDVPEFLRTHPLTLNRIAEAESRVAGLPPPAKQLQSDFPFIRAAIRARYSRRIENTIREFQAEVSETPVAELEALEYGLALALERGSQFAQALEILTRLERDATDPLRYQIAIADTTLNAGDHREAVKLLAELHGAHPMNLVVTAQYAESLIVVGDPDRAVQVLQPIVRKHPENVPLQRSLARAASESNNPLVAHTALAQYHYHRDELALALDQLYSARKFSNDDSYQSARIEARIQQFEAERLQYEK